MRSEYRALRISIHAPTRGATRFLSEDALFPLDFNPRSHEGSDSTSFTLSLILSDFNPRSHEGSDEINRMQVLHLRLFQSTLPRGERPRYSFTTCFLQHFNPRSHEGSDDRCNSLVHRVIYFNPRSHEGSDFIGPCRKDVSLFISIHAPTRGATAAFFRRRKDNGISIHAPTRGATATLTNFFFYNQSIFC